MIARPPDTAPFNGWIKPFYDLNLPGDKADLTKVLNRVIHRSHPSIRASHRTILAFIFDRTISWSKFYERITYQQFEDGVIDGNGNIAAVGTRLSRRTIAQCLQDLIEWGILMRRIEERKGERDRYLYAINFGEKVRIKTRSSALFTCNGQSYTDSIPELLNPKKQIENLESVNVRDTLWTPCGITESNTMMPIPKKKRNLVPVLKPVAEEEAPSVYIGHCDRFTSDTSNGGDQFTIAPLIAHTESAESKSTEHGAGSAQIVQDRLNEHRRKRETRHAGKIESLFSKETASIKDIETLWKYNFEKIYATVPFAWSIKDKGMISTMQKKWNASKETPFITFLDWVINRWESIGSLWFNFQETESKEIVNKGYPDRPVIAFIAACLPTYVRAHEKASYVDQEPGMTPRERFVIRLQVRGYSADKIEQLAAQKFTKHDEKSNLQMEELKRQLSIKTQEAEFLKRKKLQPVATPIYTPTPFTPATSTDLPQWK